MLLRGDSITFSSDYGGGAPPAFLYPQSCSVPAPEHVYGSAPVMFLTHDTPSRVAACGGRVVENGTNPLFSSWHDFRFTNSCLVLHNGSWSADELDNLPDSLVPTCTAGWIPGYNLKSVRLPAGVFFLAQCRYNDPTLRMAFLQANSRSWLPAADLPYTIGYKGVVCAEPISPHSFIILTGGCNYGRWNEASPAQIFEFDTRLAGAVPTGPGWLSNDTWPPMDFRSTWSDGVSEWHGEGCVCGKIGNKLIVAGHKFDSFVSERSPFYRTTQMINLDTKTFKNGPLMRVNHGRDSFNFLSIKGRLYAIGGWVESSPMAQDMTPLLSDVEVYDEAAEVWRTAPDLPFPLATYGSVAVPLNSVCG